MFEDRLQKLTSTVITFVVVGSIILGGVVGYCMYKVYKTIKKDGT